MAVRENYDSVIRWNRNMLNVVGLWPDLQNKSSFLAKCRFVICTFIMLYFASVSQTADLFLFCRDMDSVIQNLTNANIGMSNACLKTLIWWRNKTVLWELIAVIKEDWDKPKTDMEYNEMIKMAKMGRLIAKGSTIVSQINVYIACSLQLYLNIVIYSTRQQYFRAYFPYDTSPTPIYEITWVFQLIAAFGTAVAYTAVDSFIGFFVLHICGQLAILQHEFEQLSSSYARDNPQSLDFVRKNLRYITQRHNQLLNFAEIIEDIFNKMFLVQMITLTIQVCLQIYQCIDALSNVGRSSILLLSFMTVYTFGVVLLFCVYCYVGEQLIVQTSNIRNAAYECEWYDLPTTEIKALSFIMFRTQNPPMFTAGKFCPFTMVTFSQVLKTAIGYLSVLLTVKQS